MCPKQQEMFKEIMALRFSIVDLHLYLDTHPDDYNAICLYNKYVEELNALKNNYQSMYGPIAPTTSSCPWEWIQSPWPWQKEANYVVL